MSILVKQTKLETIAEKEAFWYLLNVYATEYGQPISVPSIYNLRRRIQYLKDAKDPRFAGDIAAAVGIKLKRI